MVDVGADVVELELVLAVVANVDVLRNDRKFGSFIVKAVFAGNEILGNNRNRLAASSSASRFMSANSSMLTSGLSSIKVRP